MLIGPGAVQDCLGIDLVRLFFRLAVWVRFFGCLGLLLGSFWGAPGAVFGHFGLSWARFWLLWEAFRSLQLLSCLLFLPALCSLPMALQHFATRAGGLCAARLE